MNYSEWWKAEETDWKKLFKTRSWQNKLIKQINWSSNKSDKRELIQKRSRMWEMSENSLYIDI